MLAGGYLQIPTARISRKPIRPPATPFCPTAKVDPLERRNTMLLWAWCLVIACISCMFQGHVERLLGVSRRPNEDFLAAKRSLAYGACLPTEASSTRMNPRATGRATWDYYLLMQQSPSGTSKAIIVAVEPRLNLPGPCKMLE